jgi:rRNA-processing protein FCF1
LQKVIFDSSFLMAVVESPTTWYEDITDSMGKFQPVLLTCVKSELERLAGGEGKRARTARLALELASEFESRDCGSAKVDDEIVSAASTMGAFVATADSELGESVRAAHRKVISLSRGRVAVG